MAKGEVLSTGPAQRFSKDDAMLPDNAGDAADGRENRSRQPTSSTAGAFAHSAEGDDELLAPSLNCKPVKPAAIDMREFTRFFLSGVTATIGNMAAVWLARCCLPFEVALLVGTRYRHHNIICAFESFRVPLAAVEPRDRGSGEILIVYAGGCNLLGASNLC